MKKIIQMLLYAAVTMSGTYIQAHTNKTFLMPRPQGVNLAMESSAGWYELINRNAPERFGGHLQGILFFQDTTENCKMASYFGIKDHSKATLGTVSLAGTGGLITNAVTAQDYDLLYSIHNFNNNTETVTAPNMPADAGSIKIAPEQTVYGIYFNYYQNLDRLLKGLYLNVTMPIVRVKNETHLVILGSQATNIKSFFAGNYQVQQVTSNASASPASSPTIANAQDPLRYALLTGCNSIQTGVADIDIMIGYTCWDKQYAHTSLNLGATFPTGNRAKGVRVFEAILGNGHHYGLGMGIDFWARLCGNFEHNVKIFFKSNYRYLFSSSEYRTVGIKDRNWGQYHLLGSTLTDENNRGIPAANILNRRVEVTPGTQLDLISGISYINNSLSFDIGYNFYFREQEAVMLKNCFPSNTYGVLARHHSFTATTTPPTVDAAPGIFTGDARQIDKGAALLTTDDLDVTAAETPRQNTHKLFAGIGYRVDSWDIPVLFGIGGHAEYAFKNSAFNNWGVYAKTAIKF